MSNYKRILYVIAIFVFCLVIGLSHSKQCEGEQPIKLINPNVDFNQFDERWGNMSFAGFTMASSGCGPAAVADVIYGYDGVTTPIETATYMIENGYAFYGRGTAWIGITNCVIEHGFTCVETYNVEDIYAPLEQDAVVVLLMGYGYQDVVWTRSGHFIYVSKHKWEDGLNYLYVSDPSDKNNDGWFCVETSMSSSIDKCWICYYPRQEGITNIVIR